MGSFKALLFGGVASLAAMSTASAADLFLPPPPPVEAPVVPIDFSGGFYLRGDTGIGISNSHQGGSTVQTNVTDLRTDSNSFDDTAFVDFGIGYKFNNYFRADVTGEYRIASSLRSIESYDGTAIFGPGAGRNYDNYNGSIHSVVGLVNGYVDLGTWWCLTPYVGAGVGVAEVMVKPVTDQGPPNALGAGAGFGYSSTHSQTNFAWALMTGVAFNVTPNTKIELGYRYLNLGSASSGAIVCQNTGSCPNEIQHYKLASQDIRLGVRYMFNDVAPAPSYAQPLVRKY